MSSQLQSWGPVWSLTLIATLSHAYVLRMKQWRPSATKRFLLILWNFVYCSIIACLCWENWCTSDDHIRQTSSSLRSSPSPIPLQIMPQTIVTHLLGGALGKVHNFYAVVQKHCLLEEADHLRQVSNLSLRGTVVEFSVTTLSLWSGNRIYPICKPTPGQKSLPTSLDPMGSSILSRMSSSCGSFLDASMGSASGTHSSS